MPYRMPSCVRGVRQQHLAGIYLGVRVVMTNNATKHNTHLPCLRMLSNSEPPFTLKDPLFTDCAGTYDGVSRKSDIHVVCSAIITNEIKWNFS